jgi:hypothetical protein
MSNAGYRGRRLTLWEVLDWVRGRNPAVSIDRILDKLLGLCETGRVHAWWPVTCDGGLVVPGETFIQIPAHYWVAMGFVRPYLEAPPTGKIYAASLPRGVIVEVQFSADDVFRELQPLADAGTKPSRLKPFWPDAEIQIMDWLDENGYPRPRDGNQTKLEKFVAEWLEGHGYEASEATIRRHVQRCIGRYRRKIDTPS